MKNNKQKKGFTIVELVIVVAVIGVLTAVLVPTFANLVGKANEAADNSLVTNLNKQLEIKRATEGANKTMQDALNDALDGGYKVDNLTPTSTGKDIVWSIVEDKFYFVDSDSAPAGAKSDKLYDYFKVYKTKNDIPATQTFSIYAKGTDWSEVPTLAVGFDAGENLGIAELNFVTSEARTATIRTNGSSTVLTVNAKLATINHYDVLDGLTVTAVAGESYHEYGTIKNKAVISEGHIAIEQGASVPEVAVESATGDVKVTANEETIVVIDEESKEETSVVANSEGIFVEGAKPENVTGSKSEDVKVPALITNEAGLRAAANGFAQLGANITISTDTAIAINSKAVLDLNGYNITLDENVADATPLYNVAERGGMTIKGNGIIRGHAKILTVDGSLRIESGTFITNAANNAASTGASIIASDKSDVSIFGGDFYSAKCNFWSRGKALINGGTFTSIASTKLSNQLSGVGLTDPYAYTMILGGDSTVNGGSFYGIHGGLSHQGGQLVINGGHFETNGALSMQRYAAVADQIYAMDNRDHTLAITASTAFGGLFYPLYAAGEDFTVTCTINGGEFVNTGDKWAVHIGNSTYGDGGNRLPSFASINGGKFQVNSCAYVLKVDKYVGTCQISGGNYNKNKVNAGGTTMDLADATKILSEGCRVTEHGDGTWDVVHG